VQCDWDGWRLNAQNGGVNGLTGIVAGFGPVSIRTAELLMYCCQEPANLAGPGPCFSPTPTEAFSTIMRFAPPAIRSCSLGSSCPLDSTTGRRSWRLQLIIVDVSPKRQTSVFWSAAALAEALQPDMAAARVGLRLDEDRQEVIMARGVAA